MLWKYFQKYMYSFRENWEINLRVCHTVAHFSRYLFTISLISKVLFQCRSEITWPTFWLRGMVSICLLRKGKCDWFLHRVLLLDWLIFLLYLLQFVRSSNYSAKTTNFLFLNLFPHLLHPLVLKHLRIFITVMQSNFITF